MAPMAGLQRGAPFVGRILLSAIFLMSGIHKLFAWEQTATTLREEGMPAVHLLLAGVVVLELGGSLSLLLGFRARLGALALIIFLIPTTYIMHDFWTFTGEEQQTQMINFMKNHAILGGLFMTLACGSGAWSLDGGGSRSPGAQETGASESNSRGG